MITTVTLNAAIDKTYVVPCFPAGMATRTGAPFVMPGGKGINVARVVGQLGVPALATGFLAGMNGRSIEQMMTQQHIVHDFVYVEGGGESRLCLTIIDETIGQATELIEPGPTVHEQGLLLLKEKILNSARRSQVMIFSGSAPAGTPATIYQELITIAKGAGCRTILDASGELLVRGAEALPFVIKPNEHEIAAFLGKPMESVEELYPIVQRLNAKGIAFVVVSLGAEGCLTGFNGKLYRAYAPSLHAVNTVGCGDSFVAGLAVSLAQGDSVERTIQRAIAAGAADALTPEAGFVEVTVVDRLMNGVSVISL